MAENPNPIYAEKWEEFISPQTGKPTMSIMRYLKPLGQTNSIETPLLSDDFSQKNPSKWPIKVSFPGWRKPQKDWFDWVEKSSLKYAKIWEQTGICDAILSSLFEIKPNPEIVLGLCEFWCPKTNTFIFPWGEATITLEDVLTLVGLPVLGELVNLPLLADSMKVLDERLNRMRSDLSKRGNTKRASYSAWIEYFNEGGEERDSLEHAGFLAYWLSRFVFPDINNRTVGKHVFPIAIHLSLGVKMALGPAVLACLYQNLSFLAQNAADCCSIVKEVTVPGPFWIVQMWALERFSFLGSNLAKPLSLGQPRAARWDKVVVKENLVSISSALRSGEGFLWRPYALDLENWHHRSFYPVNEMILSGCSTLEDEELKSFWVCLHSQQLVGIDCAEIYRPQRVAMQFGYDQDLHGELITSIYVELKNGSMFVPSRFSQPKMSLRYWNFLKESMIPRIESETSTPRRELTDKLQDESDTTRELCTAKEDWSSKNVILLDLDEEEVGRRDNVVDQPSHGANKTKRRVIGGSADDPLYVSDQFRPISRKVRRSGISLKNPIDVENYY